MASAVPSSIPPPKHATRAIGTRPRMSRFLRILIAITAAVHVPFFLGTSELLARLLAFPGRWLVAACLASLGVLFFVARARAGMFDRRKGPLEVWIIDIPYFIHWCACVFTIVPSIVCALVWPLVQISRAHSASLPLPFFLWTYAMGVVVCGYGILIRRRWFVVREIDVALKGLDPKFDGYRIAQLSDLHIGTTTSRAWGDRWARAANKRVPDLAVVTGDLVTSGTEFYGDVAAVLGSLRAKDGVFVTMGNHDYFGDGEPLVRRIQDHGPRVLRNEGVLIDRDGAKLYLAGIDDTWTKRDDLDRALANRPPSTPTILLSHDPARFRDAAKRNVELTLSGHTHGGQIAFPFLYKWITLSRLTHHYHLGVYKRGDSTLYVHPGLGTTGPPMRLGIAPAVVIVTLRVA